MASISMNTTALQANFDSLSAHRQAAQWVAFVDALDAGDAGFHPYYEVLAPLYERGASPFDIEADEELEAVEIEIGDERYDVYIEELVIGSRATEYDLLGSPPF